MAKNNLFRYFRNLLEGIIGVQSPTDTLNNPTVKRPSPPSGEAIATLAGTTAAGSGLSALGGSAASALAAALSLGYGIYQDQRSWNNFSPGSKESLDYQDSIADENATVAYMRQKAFQEQYLMPEAQLRSLARGYESVGLNKMGLAGFQSGASSSSVSPAESGSPSSNSPTAVGELISSLIGAFQQGQRIDIEGSHVAAQNKLLDAQAEAQNIENRYKDEYLSTQLSYLKENIAQVRANTRKLISEGAYSEYLALYAPALLEANVQNSESQIRLNDSMSKLNDARKREVDELVKNHRKERELMDSNISKIASEIELICSQKNLTEQEIKESEARVSKLNAEVKKIGTEIGLSELDIKYYIWNHPRTVSLPGGIKYNRSSENGRNGYTVSGLTDEEILWAARDRGLIKD